MSHQTATQGFDTTGTVTTGEPPETSADHTQISEEEWAALESICGKNKWYFIVQHIRRNNNQPTQLTELNQLCCNRFGEKKAKEKTRYPAQTLGAHTMNNQLVKARVSLRIKHVDLVKGSPFEGSLQVHRVKFQARFSAKMRKAQQGSSSELLVP